MKWVVSLRWSIAALGGVGLLATLLMVGQGLVTRHKLNQTTTMALAAKDAVADILPPPLYLIEARLVVSQAQEGSMPPAKAAQELERIAAGYRSRVDYWRAHPPYGLERFLLGPQHEAGQKFLESARIQVIDRLLAGDGDAARRALPELQALYEQHRAGVDGTVVEGNALAARSISAFEQAEDTAVVAANVTAMLAALLVTGLTYGVVRSIERPLKRCSQVAQRMATGDLAEDTESLSEERADAIGALEASLRDMRSQLARIVGQVRHGSDSIATGTEQIAAGNVDLSQRTEAQAGSLQQTAASMEQLSCIVKTGADVARDANQLASQAAEAARVGGEKVGQVIGTMQDISASSQKIADIIGVIDGIAFQTNILALNAAVEAARAGEQGRGFAVVAGEVRTLAQRSAGAAKEIKNLIEASVERVDAGTRQVDEAGAAMQDIVAQARRVSQMISELTTAATEQSQGISQVGDAVHQLDQVTQQNAALVEETADAAESLRHQVGQLTQAMSQFKLDSRAESACLS